MTTGQRTSLEQSSLQQSSLQQRLARCEALEAIRGLVAVYAEAADRRNDPVLMRPLYTDDATWEAAGFGAYQGADLIVAELSRIATEEVVWSLHLMGPPAITLTTDGTSARVTWRLWELSKLAQQGLAPRDHWLGGGYDATAIRDKDGQWRFSRVILTLSLIAPVGDPWVPIPAPS